MDAIFKVGYTLNECIYIYAQTYYFILNTFYIFSIFINLYYYICLYIILVCSYPAKAMRTLEFLYSKQ